MSTPAPALLPLPLTSWKLPNLSSWFNPTTTDLVTWAAHMTALAKQCEVNAPAGALNNPYATIGALQSLTESMEKWLRKRLEEEERNLLLLDRLRHEAAQDLAHEHLMATDAEYAEDFEGEGEGDDE